jgi:hypothetical protein
MIGAGKVTILAGICKRKIGREGYFGELIDQ